MEIAKSNSQPQNPSIKGSSHHRQSIPKEYLEVATGMEIQFVDHMLAEMEKTVQHEDEDSSAMNFYKSQLNYERAKAMSDSYMGDGRITNEAEKGIGLKKAILEQIYPQYNKKNSISKNEKIALGHKGEGHE